MVRGRLRRVTVSASACVTALAGALIGPALATAAPAASGTGSGPVTTATAVHNGAAFRYANTTFAAGSGFGSPGSQGSTQLPSALSPSQMPRTPDVDSGDGTLLAPNVNHRASGPRGSNSGLPSTGPAPVTGPTAGLTSVSGNNAYELGQTHNTGSLPGVDVEPPDQGVCANGTYTMEVNNEIEQVWGSDGVSRGVQALEKLFASPEIFGGSDGSFSVQGDPRCFWDTGSGRWFASQIWFDYNHGWSGDTNPLPYSGAFVAVSNSSDPTGAWTSYFVPDLSALNGADGCSTAGPAAADSSNPCLGDQPLLGVDQNTVQISTNEYGLGSGLPNGDANLYFLSKRALLAGAPTVAEDWAPVGAALKAPEAAGLNWSSWASIVPAQVPNGAYVTANRGTSYGLSDLDFAGTGDNKIAEWVYTNTVAVDTQGPINIFEQTLTSGSYAFPPNAVQKSGPTPLGDAWNSLNGAGPSRLPEGALAANDDRLGTAAYDPSTGALVGALNTGIDQNGYGHVLGGIAVVSVTPAFTAATANHGATLAPSPVTTSYLSAQSSYIQFPVIAITPSGRGVLAYSLSGQNDYPSTAYSLITAGDTLSPTVHIARAGVGPQDGFSEYQDFGTANYRPRWGDYSAAQVVGNSVTFATEMINQSCTDAQFQADFTCGGTRDLFANWGTSVNTITP